jgi:uncharacterized RDD family membrane protein YckC
MTEPTPPPGYGAPPWAPPEPAGLAGTIPTLWARIGARLFDELLLLIPSIAVTLPYLRLDSNTGIDGIPRWVTVVTLVIPVVYEIAFLAVRGATPGKMLVGIGVRNAADGGRIVPYQAGLRVLIPALGGALALGVPSAEVASLCQLITPFVYTSALWDPRRRGLHDKAAGTIVLRTR